MQVAWQVFCGMVCQIPGTRGCFRLSHFTCEKKMFKLGKPLEKEKLTFSQWTRYGLRCWGYYQVSRRGHSRCRCGSCRGGSCRGRGCCWSGSRRGGCRRGLGCFSGWSCRGGGGSSCSCSHCGCTYIPLSGIERMFYIDLSLLLLCAGRLYETGLRRQKAGRSSLIVAVCCTQGVPSTVCPTMPFSGNIRYLPIRLLPGSQCLFQKICVICNKEWSTYWVGQILISTFQL